MGWDAYPLKRFKTKKQFIKYLIKPAQIKTTLHDEVFEGTIRTLRYQLNPEGNRLWCVRALYAKARPRTVYKSFISCILVEFDEKYGWFTREVYEDWCPAYYDVPLSFLNIGKDFISEVWRYRVLMRHLQSTKKLKVSKKKEIKPEKIETNAEFAFVA